jgi:autotransporter-associated beta strand protein
VTGGLVEGLGVNSNFVITSGSLGLMSGGGTYVIGNLSGAGGSIATGQDNVANGNSTHTLQVNQTANGTYAGSISQSDVTRVFALTKQGSSSLTLTGALSYRGTTTVTAGTLVIDSTTGTGVGAVAVNGGTFSGTGTINTNGNAFTVTGGNLAAGLDGTAGKLTIAGSGAVNISLLSGSGQLKFDLASNTLTSDGVLLTGSGVLNIGTLDFAEFTFTNIGGLAAGTYTLFDTNAAITGSIGVASGAIDGSFNGSLSIVGQDVVLTVTAVPEPGVCALVLVGGMAVLLKRKRHAQI